MFKLGLAEVCGLNLNFDLIQTGRIFDKMFVGMQEVVDQKDKVINEQRQHIENLIDEKDELIKNLEKLTVEKQKM